MKPAEIAPEQTLSIYSHGDPTDEEQYMLELINRARANPDSEGIRLQTTTDANITQSYKYWQSPTPAQVGADFHTYPAKPPLAFNAKLITAARGHDQKMIQVDSQYHVGPDGDPGSRISNAGYNVTGGWGENVFAFGNTDIWYDHATFQIDFGNPSLGHRHNIMNFDAGDILFTEVGLGIVHGGSGYPHVGTVLTTQDYGNRPERFILGVVYVDANHNGMYDPGEGISGITITASGGQYSAMTSTSGGYAIPYSGSGSVMVTASGSSIGGSIQQTIQFSGDNVKVDFIPSTALQVSLLSPPADTLLNTSSFNFSWSSVTGASKYRIQVATDAQMKNLVVNDSSLSSTSKLVTGLKDDSTYYWRAQAKTSSGWALYSGIASFSVILPPGAVTLLTPANGAGIGSADAALSWRQTSPRVAGYWVILADNKALTNPLISDSTSLSYPSDTSYNAGAGQLQPSQRYYWTARAENDGGWSAVGQTWSFATGTLSVTDQTQRESVTISPNPANEQANLAFSLPSDEQVSIRIFNSLGEELASQELGRLSAGAHNWTWNASTLPAGSYVYELRAGERLDVGRIQLVK